MRGRGDQRARQAAGARGSARALRRGDLRDLGGGAESDRHQRRPGTVFRRPSGASIRSRLRGCRPRGRRHARLPLQRRSRSLPRRAARPSTRALRRISASRCRTRYPTRSRPSCGIAGMAGWMPVAWRAPVKEDDRVLVLGATGTVGLVAVQAAKLLGAKHVVAAGRNPERLDARGRARRGCHREPRAGRSRERLQGGGGRRRPHVRRRHGLGRTGGRPRTQAAAPGWRLVQIGQSAGAEASLASARDPREDGRDLRLHGLRGAAGRASASTTCGSSVTPAAGDIVFDIDSYPLERIARPGSGRPTAPTGRSW